MFDLLFAKTFLIVGGMLVITTFFSRINKAYETISEAIITIAGSFILLFAIMFFDEIFPLNIILVGVFSGFVGWSLGPTIGMLGESYKMRKYIKASPLESKTVITNEKRSFMNKFFGPRDEKKTMYYLKSDPKKLFDSESEQYKTVINEIITGVSFKRDTYQQDWQNIVFQAMMATTLAVLFTAGLVFSSSFNFGIMGGYLFIALIILIIMGILNALIFKSRFFSLIKAYAGVIVFTGYLLYDFNILEERMNIGDDSWSSAVRISVNLYLDIINLFLDLLQILAESGGN